MSATHTACAPLRTNNTLIARTEIRLLYRSACASHLHTEQYVVRTLTASSIHLSYRHTRWIMAYRSLTMTMQTTPYVSSTSSCGVRCVYIWSPILWHHHQPSAPADHCFCTDGDCFRCIYYDRLICDQECTLAQ